MNAPCWVVFYHYVRPAETATGAGIRALSTDEFVRQLDWLQARADVIDYPAFARAVAERRGFARPSVLLTFDDGVADHAEPVSTELQRRGLSGVFFLNGDPAGDPPRLVNVHRTHLLLDRLGARALLEAVRALVTRDVEAGTLPATGLYRYDGEPEQIVKRLLNYDLPYVEADRVLAELTAEHLGDEAEVARRFYLSHADIRDMVAAGMTFGYHTKRHRVLSRLDEAGQLEELAGGVALVRELTGQTAVPFCYPYGHRQTYDATTVRLLEAQGYETAFTTGRRPARADADPVFEIPRFDTVDLPPRGALEIAAEGALRP